MKNRYYDTTKKSQAVYEGVNPSSHLIKDDDERVKNFFEPTPEGYRKAYDENGLPFNELIPQPTQAELDEQALQTSISEAQALLKDTDFYVIRKMEESIDIPADVVTARAEAKQLLRDNNISYTLGAK